MDNILDTLFPVPTLCTNCFRSEHIGQTCQEVRYDELAAEEAEGIFV